jgi:hypothetical protein
LVGDRPEAKGVGSEVHVQHVKLDDERDRVSSVLRSANEADTVTTALHR